jgi:hypothetical protein
MTGTSALGPTQFESAQQLRDEALKLLVRATRELLEETGEAPTASQVKVRMSALSFGGFNLKRLGYSRFRELVAEADSRDLIATDTARAGDIALVPKDRLAETRLALSPIKRSLWRAVVDWAPNMLRLWDIKDRRAFVVPVEPVLLEPERFKIIRTRYSEDATAFLPIPHLGREDQYEMFDHFVDELTLSAEVAKRLEAARATDRPLRESLEVLREHYPHIPLDWAHVIRLRVQELLEQWVGKNPVLDISDLLEMERRIGAWHSEQSRSHGGHIEDEQRIRELLHGAIDRMPIEALRQLSIPIGYLFPEK